MTVDVSLIVGVADGATGKQTLQSLEIVNRLSDASGTWVMFTADVDSLDRHAAKNLLLAAEANSATLALSGAVDEIEVLTAGQLQSRLAHLDVDGLLFNRAWLQSRVLLADELAEGVRQIPTSALHEAASVALIPQQTFATELPTILDRSRTRVHAGPVSRLAGLAFSIARVLPPSNRIVVDVNAERPVDSAFNALALQWQQQNPEVRFLVITKAMRDSWKHAWHLGRAHTVVTNEQFISRLPKRVGQRQVVAVHELPLVRTGRDNPDWVLQPTSERRPSRSQVERWDLVVTSSPFATEVLRYSSAYVGPVLEGPSVFADAMAAAGADRDLRHRLGLEAELPVVLLALRSSESEVPVAALIERFAARLQFVVVTDDGSGVGARQVFDDLPSWCAAADLMVTDWSSLVMEFAGALRPIVAFQPDALDVVRRRGTNLNLAELLPGPVVSSPSELVQRLEQWLAGGAQAFEEFVERSGEFSILGSRATGDAAARILDAIGLK